MSLETVFLLLGFALLSAILVAAVCSVVYPEAQRSAREWVNTAISIVTLVVLAWTARSIVDQVTEMRKVYPEIQSQSKAIADQVAEMRKIYPEVQSQAQATAAQLNSFISTERARLVIIPIGVQRNGVMDREPKFTYSLTNMGRTAALITGLLTECEVIPSAIIPPPSYGDKTPDAAAQPLLPGASWPGQEGHECHLSHPLTEEEFAGLTAKNQNHHLQRIYPLPRRVW
jgi:hypothetical protein